MVLKSSLAELISTTYSHGKGFRHFFVFVEKNVRLQRLIQLYGLKIVLENPAKCNGEKHLP